MQAPLYEKHQFDAIMVEEADEPRLPTYEEAVGLRDSARLPSYSKKRRARFHPYARYKPTVVNRADRLLNTVFDEEYLLLNVPPARPGTYRRIPPLEPDYEAYVRIRRNMARALEFEQRVARLHTVIGDFIQGVRRAHGH